MSAETARCHNCASEQTEEFNAEIAVHFPGLEGLNKPIVWVFPRTRVCMTCGLSVFPVPETQLKVLIHGVPVEGAIISTAQKTPKKSTLI